MSCHFHRLRHRKAAEANKAAQEASVVKNEQEHSETDKAAQKPAGSPRKASKKAGDSK